MLNQSKETWRQEWRAVHARFRPDDNEILHCRTGFKKISKQRFRKSKSFSLTSFVAGRLKWISPYEMFQILINIRLRVDDWVTEDKIKIVLIELEYVYIALFYRFDQLFLGFTFYCQQTQSEAIFKKIIFW